MYSSTLSLTSALELLVGGQHHAPAALSPGKDPVPIVQRLGGPQVRKILPPPGFDPTELSRPLSEVPGTANKQNHDICRLMGYYAVSGNSYPTFRFYFQEPRIQEDRQVAPETSVRNYHHSLRNNPEERTSHLLRGGKTWRL